MAKIGERTGGVDVRCDQCLVTLADVVETATKIRPHFANLKTAADVSKVFGFSISDARDLCPTCDFIAVRVFGR
jgi:hypothetical protein